MEDVDVKNLTFGGVLSSNACDFSGSGRVEGKLWEYLGFEQVIVFQLFVKGGLGFVRKNRRFDKIKRRFFGIKRRFILTNLRFFSRKNAVFFQEDAVLQA